jgi:hypothetical protein
VPERVDEHLFVQLIEHIRSQGYQGTFYQMKITYYDEDGLTYWTMGAPVEETIIMNRCKKEDTYEVRREEGGLPDQDLSNVLELFAEHAAQRLLEWLVEPCDVLAQGLVDQALFLAFGGNVRLALAEANSEGTLPLEVLRNELGL